MKITQEMLEYGFRKALEITSARDNCIGFSAMGNPPDRHIVIHARGLPAAALYSFCMMLARNLSVDITSSFHPLPDQTLPEDSLPPVTRKNPVVEPLESKRRKRKLSSGKVCSDQDWIQFMKHISGEE